MPCHPESSNFKMTDTTDQTLGVLVQLIERTQSGTVLGGIHGAEYARRGPCDCVSLTRQVRGAAGMRSRQSRYGRVARPM
jgi:hypothetical protein